jgi:hypothetical protein
LFAQVDEEVRLWQGPARLRDVLAFARIGEISLEEAYMALKTIAHPWLIRRWAESKTADGQPLVVLIQHMTEDVYLSVTTGVLTGDLYQVLRPKYLRGTGILEQYRTL